MANQFTSQRAASSRLLAKFGQPMVLKGAGSADYDPATGSALAAAVSGSTRMGAAFDCTEREIDGTTILMGDKNVTLAYMLGTAEPVVGDVLSFGGKDHRIMFVDALAPSGVAILHRLRVRA